MSRFYDLFAGFEAQHRAAGLHILNPQPGERILEIGAGTGRALQAIATALGASGSAHGIDLSPGMLRVSHSRLAKAGLAGQVGLERGDARCLPFEAGCFDGVFMSFTLELFSASEIPQMLAECRRVLKTGGRICIVAMSAKNKPNRITQIYSWFHEKFPEYVDCRPIDVPAAVRSAGFRRIDGTERPLFGLSTAIVSAQKE
jgi:ubiquinone/menaquinone biosynthesis C-methylase UbiE